MRPVLSFAIVQRFADHFSGAAAAYAAHRPDYPAELFAFAAALAPGRSRAWDCATGNGQAAIALASHFARVAATDASAAQLAHARSHPRVSYHVALAEASAVRGAAVELVTVAQALHWFRLDRFYAEVRRVLVPGGALCVWSYDDPTVDEPALDAALQRFNHEIMGPWWPTDRAAVGEGYRTLPFPFAELPAPTLVLERWWTADELVAYVRTWSAVARARAAGIDDPVRPLEAELRALTAADRAARHHVRWPLVVRAGRVTD
ncbi:MAG TPA: class I SAM-dependent methyltransferase [Gemmatimonadaceae bacterium]|nr:class I SAM-dependent methyltransferase [Gemmatimonadaceae bacterium]